MLDKLEKALTSKADFIEIRAGVSNTTRVRLRGSEVESAGSGTTSGFSARALYNGAWGFAYTSEQSRLWDAVERAARLAKASSRKPIGASLAGKSSYRDSVVAKPKKPPQDFGLDEKVSLCKEILPEKKDGIVAHDLDYADGWGESYYVNSEGAAIEYFPSRSFIAFSAFSKKNGELLSARDAAAGLSGVEILDGKEKLTKKVVADALLMQEAVLPPKGKMRVVIDPKMAGVFAHEMVGHAAEGDAVANGKSILRGKVGRLIGSRHVTITDDPTSKGLFGSYPYDSEGIKAQKTVLVDKGRIAGLMHSRESAARMGEEPTGNARAESTAHFPIVRMSNTFFERGDRSMEELFEGVDGVYAIGSKGGVTEPHTGYFQFAAEMGWLVKNGERQKPLRDITLVGHLLDALRGVEGCGKTVRLGHPGFCGKAGQSVPVSDGGPHVRIKGVLVG